MKKFKQVLYTNKSTSISSASTASKIDSEPKERGVRNPQVLTCGCGKVVKTSRYHVGKSPYKCHPCRYPAQIKSK